MQPVTDLMFFHCLSRLFIIFPTANSFSLSLSFSSFTVLFFSIQERKSHPKHPPILPSSVLADESAVKLYYRPSDTVPDFIIASWTQIEAFQCLKRAQSTSVCAWSALGSLLPPRRSRLWGSYPSVPPEGCMKKGFMGVQRCGRIVGAVCSLALISQSFVTVSHTSRSPDAACPD